MVKIWATLLAAAAVALSLGVGAAAAFSKQDVTIVAADGTPLAASLFLPGGTPPSGGWPAVVYMHGLAGDRSSMNALAQAMGVVGEQYAVLTFDARGHGQSGGLIGIDGPKEIADVKTVHAWLRDRPEVSDTRIGAWGISYGGGAALNSLVAGVPWAALEVAETWSDLYSALAPQGLAKTGVVGGFLASLPPAKIDPSVIAVRDAAFAGRSEEVASWASSRSSLAKLRGVRTPVFFMQGRRDFAFGLDQAKRAYAALQGPKRLWIGNHGHAPSSFPATDSTAMLTEGKQWLDRYVRGAQTALDVSKPIVIAASGSARVTRLETLPKTLLRGVTLPGTQTIAQSGKSARRTQPTKTALEVFGAPTVKVELTARGGWSRLVAVLSARTQAGQEIVVAGGGVPAAPGRRTVTIRLIDQATFVPKGSRLTLTLGASSLAQSPSNLLYLDLPMPPAARATIGSATLTLPVLRQPVSR